MATPGQVLKNGRLEITVLQTSASTGGALLELDARYGPGSRRPPPHFHPKQEERFRILEGAMQFLIDGQLREAREGEEVVLAPRVVHAIWNAGTVPARLVWQTRPALRSEDSLEAVFSLAGDDVPVKGFRRLLQIAAIASAHRDEMRLARRRMQAALLVLGLVARVLGYRTRVAAP